MQGNRLIGQDQEIFGKSEIQTRTWSRAIPRSGETMMIQLALWIAASDDCPQCEFHH